MGKGQDLLEAARKGDEKSVEKILLQAFKRSGPFPSLRRTPVVNVKDDSGYTPLHHASLQGHREIVRQLLSCDANPCLTNDKGATPLHLAAFKGDGEIVAMLLAHNNPPVNVNQVTLANETALIMAAQFGSVNVVTQLLTKGADVNIRNVKDESALDLAAQYGRLKTVKRLIKIHPSLVHPYKLPNWRVRNFSNTPLHRASKNGHDDVVAVLLAAGIDPNIRTSSGTPLHEAACFGKATVVQILLDAGADLNALDGSKKTVEDLLADYSEEATRKVRRVIREYKSRKRNNYESEDDVPPFPIQDSPTISIPSGMSHINNEFPTITLPAPTTTKACINNLSNNNVSNADSNTSENQVGMPGSRCTQNYVLILPNQKQPYTEIYENIPTKCIGTLQLSTSSSSLGDEKKKPKPLPKPIKLFRNVRKIPEYVNCMDESPMFISVDGAEENKYIEMAPVAKKEIKSETIVYESITSHSVHSDMYIDIDQKKLITSASCNGRSDMSFELSESYRRETFITHDHYRGDPGCKHDKYYFTITPVPVSPSSKELLKKELQFERLPCFCHEKDHALYSKIPENIYYCCENEKQPNQPDEESNLYVNDKQCLIDNSLENMEFDPFDKNKTGAIKQRSGRKNIFKKKMSQLIVLIGDWS